MTPLFPLAFYLTAPNALTALLVDLTASLLTLTLLSVFLTVLLATFIPRRQ